MERHYSCLAWDGGDMVCLYGVDRVCDQLCEFKVIDGCLIVGASVVDCSEAQTQHNLQIQPSWIEMSNDYSPANQSAKSWSYRHLSYTSHRFPQGAVSRMNSTDCGAACTSSHGWPYLYWHCLRLSSVPV